jgi:hypothetical protein
MEFCMTESCGKCVPCRVGTVQMHDLLKKIIDRKATERDVKLLEELCDMVKSTSLCGLGQSAPNPVLTTLRYFRKEYDDLLIPPNRSPPAQRRPSHECCNRDVVTLKIDGKDVGGRADETILDVCKENKIHIPTLCFLRAFPAGAPAASASSRSRG